MFKTIIIMATTLSFIFGQDPATGT
ncbi:uncharacterized protein METZ01_LOCUS97342, partial [marine metagenome]